MDTIINIVKSLVKMNNWTVLRLDIQAIYNDTQDDIESYVGFLDVKDVGPVSICDNGTIYN